MALWPSTIRIARGAQHSRRACPGGPTATSSRVCPNWALVAERRTWKMRLVVLPVPIVICRFLIPSDGSLTVTIGPWQAIAVHTGALGLGLPTPGVATQVSVIFSETATTTLGEVSALSLRGLVR